MALSFVPDPSVNIPHDYGLHHDILDRALPEPRPRCAWCFGLVWIGGVVVAYPAGKRPGFVLHSICEAVARAAEPDYYTALVDPAAWSERSDR